MARSRRYSLKMEMLSARSDRKFKEGSNRALRRQVRMAMHANADLDSLVLPIARETRNVWDDSAKDGKCYFGDMTHEDIAVFMRK